MLAALPLALALAPAGAQEPHPILTVSRQRLLNETAYARALVEAEQRMTGELQSRIDETKRELAAREQELARLRATSSKPSPAPSTAGCGASAARRSARRQCCRAPSGTSG